MNEEDFKAALPVAVVEDEKPGFSFIWLIPLVALLVGLVMLYKDYRDTGPDIEIYFSSAEGIEPKHTQIKYRDVVVGQVRAVRFSDDFSHVIVAARLTRDMDALLSENTRFWVVRPRIGASGASGIGTLFSGPYIAIDPGKPGEYQDEFIGLEDPPTVLSDAEGRLIRLRAARLDSITIGSPVYHRDIEVGEVTGYHLEADDDYVLINVFINSPYDRLLRSNTRFWNVSGLSLDLGGDGLEVKMESLLSLLAGGIAFETPDTLSAVTDNIDNQIFPLYESYEQSRQKVIHLTLPYVLYFDESVRGLSVGAPVEFRGIRIGSVKEISVHRSRENGRMRVAVLVGLEPERVPFDDQAVITDLADQQQYFDQLLRSLVEQGLRARLVTGNLLTGQLIVDLGMSVDAQPASIDYEGPYPVLPTETGTLNGITQRLASILDKIEQLPFERIGNDLAQTMQGLNGLVNDPATRDLIVNLSRSTQQLDELLQFINGQTDEWSQDVQLLVKDMRNMLNNAAKTLETLQVATSSQSVLSTELERSLRAMTEAARAVTSVANYLERHPEALLKGKSR